MMKIALFYNTLEDIVNDYYKRQITPRLYKILQLFLLEDIYIEHINQNLISHLNLLKLINRHKKYNKEIKYVSISIILDKFFN